MGYFPVRYNSRVVIYEHRMFIRLATDVFDYRFKDGKEFYRAVPGAQVRLNRRLIFPQPGVKVDFENSKVRFFARLKAHSHLLQQSPDSTVDCVNT